MYLPFRGPRRSRPGTHHCSYTASGNLFRGKALAFGGSSYTASMADGWQGRTREAAFSSVTLDSIFLRIFCIAMSQRLWRHRNPLLCAQQLSPRAPKDPERPWLSIGLVGAAAPPQCWLELWPAVAGSFHAVFPFPKAPSAGGGMTGRLARHG